MPKRSEEKHPIFIVGCQRSGTSLLRRLLDSHPSIACPPESAFLVQLARVFEIKRALQGLLNMGFSERDVLDRMREFTTHFLSEYAHSRSKPRWAEKTTHYVNHVDTIDKMFDGEVLYVGIARHGLDVAHSLAGFDWGVLEPYLEGGTEREIACVRFWADQNEKILAFAERVGDRFFALRYEDLTSRPEETLRPLFEFLDEPWNPGVLDFARAPHDTGFEDPKISDYSRIEKNSGNYRSWPEELQARPFCEGREMLTRLGFALDDSPHEELLFHEHDTGERE